ncbi:diguanylate cyclase [Undibacterium sp.]|uniref:diguanylate cyclase n=1 Tax=Undibacterium sp. TaxID=1914977 RepID=UPI0037514F99
MPNSVKTKNTDRYRTLQERYGSGLPGRIAEIEEIWLEIKSSSDQSGLANELRRQVHGIAGSAGTFGFSRMSEVAHQFDALLYRALDDGSDLKAASESITPLVNRMQHLAAAGPDVINTYLDKVTEPKQASRLVYLIEDDPLQAEKVSGQLRVFGWDVQVFVNTTVAEAALVEQAPAAIIVDIGMPEGELAGAHMMKRQNLKRPKIFISARWDWQARLAAVHAGADAYFRKPVDVNALSAVLTDLTEPSENEPYRILIVDDMQVLAEHYAAVLQQAGMRTMVVTDPAELINAVENFSPELVLLDLYMPDCSGVDVAKVLRQDTELIGLPIVFLSTEHELSRQLSAMKIGADDFIEKPIEDTALTSIVATRASRFRTLSSLMNRDSMTRLHNHSAIKSRLEVELGSAMRTNRALSFVMIDIDHFKLVNDTYGHPAGDRVIRSLALMLSQRLRKSDFVGRYGGEEFGIIMPETTLEQAEEVVNELRKQFSMINFPGLPSFNCTFSAGIAEASFSMSRDEMIDMADKALYSAKENGRNRVSIAKL